MYKLNSLEYSFGKSGKGKKIFLEKPITLSRNDLVAVVGPSGGGKTTFLKILKGIIPEYSSGELTGDITFEGRSLDGLNFQENLSKILYLFQNPFSQLIYPQPEEEFLFSMENFNFTKVEMTAQKEKFETLFGLKNIWGKKNSDLSNGECQKLVLASLLAINPDVLLLDEPTAFLDPEARKEFYTYLEKIKGDRLVIIIDHHVDEIKNIVNKVIEVSIDGVVREKPSLEKEDLQTHQQFDLQNIGLPHFPNKNLKVENLNFSYEKTAPLLNNLNAEILSGEIVAIKGKNGIGKSTLLKLIADIIKPTSGRVTLGNSKIFPQTGFIFQNPEAHFFYDSIEEELKQSFKHITSDDLKTDLLTRFFHDIDLKKSPFLLSEGEKRRLSILMTIFLGKSLLLYDEPTFGQDPSSIREISALMKELKKLGLIQVLISHDTDFINQIADRVFVLDAGGLHEIS